MVLPGRDELLLSARAPYWTACGAGRRGERYSHSIVPGGLDVMS